MNTIENVSRRGFLKIGAAAGTFVLAARVLPEQLWADQAAVFNPDLFLFISSDNTVTIVAGRSEMGCGSRTSVPLVLADELDADWTKVKLAAGHWRQEIRRPGHRRLALGAQLLRPDACDRSDGTNDAGYSRRATVEGARFGMFHRAELRWCTSQPDGS